MKHLIILTILTLGISVSAFGQRHERQKEKMDALRIAFLTEKLDLTTDEWQRFWPIYNKYNEQMEQYKSKRFPFDHGSDMQIDRQANGSAEAQLNGLIEAEEAALALKKEYFRELSAATSAETVLDLIEAERNFRKRLLNKYRKGKEKGMKQERKMRQRQNNGIGIDQEGGI